MIFNSYPFDVFFFQWIIETGILFPHTLVTLRYCERTTGHKVTFGGRMAAGIKPRQKGAKSLCIIIGNNVFDLDLSYVIYLD